jgi:hypothetical protein
MAFHGFSRTKSSVESVTTRHLSFTTCCAFDSLPLTCASLSLVSDFEVAARELESADESHAFDASRKSEPSGEPGGREEAEAADGPDCG